MKKAAFILIYLSLLGCASKQIVTSHKKEVLSHQEEVITEIPNKPSLKGQVKRYKERSYTPIFQKLSQKDSIFSRWSETPYFEIEYFFDSKGNIVKEYQQVKEQTDSLYYISESKYLYNEKGKLMQKIFKEGAFSQTDNNQYKYIYYTNYIYDDKNRLIEEEECALDLLEGKKVIYTYDEYGNIIEKISFTDNNNYFYKEIYNYDNENRQISYKKIYITNGYKDEIKKNTWKYDSLGRIIEEYIYELSTTQHKGGTLIYNNAIRYYKYNTNGKLFEIKDQYLSDSILAQGATHGHTYYAYDLKGNLLCKSNFGDGKLRWRECYDACQHLVEEVYVSQEGETYRKQHYYQEDTYHNLIERLIISDSPVELSRYEIEYYRE
jgi:lipoprotein